MARWAEATLDRDQMAMFTPTLDSMIPADHPVRLVDEILSALDWSEWEGRYDGRVGQPPIHPRIVASVILYGMSLGMRSSRALERACGNNIDFIWLSIGRVLDHSTICDFRTRFGAELKGLFRQLGRVAMGMGLVRLNQVGLDGTRIKANSSNGSRRTAGSLSRELAALDEQIEQMFAQAEQADVRDNEWFEPGQSANKLPRELSELSRRQARLHEALSAAQAKDVARGVGRREAGAESEKKAGESRASTVPVTDPDSTIQPNKEGGFAPNYTPLATVDGRAGLIVDSAVLADSDEASQTVATVDRVGEAFGQKPEQLLADTAHGSGVNLAGLADRGVDAYIPIEQRPDRSGNPAHRADPTQPVPEGDWAKLPRDARHKTLDRSAFVYDASADCYYCPLGHRLNLQKIQDRDRGTGGPVTRIYRAENCVGCPLATACVKSASGLRTISRDQHEPLREAMEAKLKTPAGQAAYGRRRWICETVFGTIKSVMGVRQFLLRGLAKVKMEWDWVCTAFNLRKMARAVGSLRVRLAGLMD